MSSQKVFNDLDYNEYVKACAEAKPLIEKDYKRKYEELKSLTVTDGFVFYEDLQKKPRFENRISRKRCKDAGIDICTPKEIVLSPRSPKYVNLLYSMIIPDHYFGQLFMTSTAVRNFTCVELKPCVIDCNFRGSVFCQLYNHSKHEVIIPENTRFFQLIIQPCFIAPVKEALPNMIYDSSVSRGYR